MRALFHPLLCLILLGVSAVGGLICLIGFEAVSTGINPGTGKDSHVGSWQNTG